MSFGDLQEYAHLFVHQAYYREKHLEYIVRSYQLLYCRNIFEIAWYIPPSASLRSSKGGINRIATDSRTKSIRIV